jgi:CNT family concentrative nucleoside transporter
MAAFQRGEIDAALVPIPGTAAAETTTLDRLMQSAMIDNQLPPSFEADLGARVLPGNKGIEVPRFPQGIVFAGVQSFFDLIQKSVEQGTTFMFGAHPPATDPMGVIGTFAFGVLPTVIFFASLMSVLYYLGIMQRVVKAMAWLMQKTLRTTAAESLATAANVFVGHTEAPLVVKPYISTMTRSELNALMVGGFSTISGSLMAIFAAEGISAGHLLTASIISAPAALVIAKILLPETETPVPVDRQVDEGEHSASNVIEAAAIGASEGMKLAINIGAMLIAFLALIAFFNIVIGWIGSLAGMELSLDRIFGWLFAPLAWLMGIARDDCAVAGNLLGKKMVINEFVAYLDLKGVAVDNLAAGDGITERTRVILTYALCGFSNFGAIGIQLGGIGPLAPNRRGDLARLGLRAMFGGMLAACMTACIAGMFFGVLG